MVGWGGRERECVRVYTISRERVCEFILSHRNNPIYPRVEEQRLN